MPRSLAPVAVACALALLVSSCSLLEGEEEEPDPLDFPPNELSPDRIVHCEEEGDCGEEGAVRWSTPLEGEYRVTAHHPESGSYSMTVPAEDFAVPDVEGKGHNAQVHDGTLYLRDGDRLSAFDAETGERLWADEHIDPDRNKAGRHLWTAGDTLALQAIDPRTEEWLVYLVQPRRDGADWTQVEPTDPGGLKIEAVVDGTHFLMWSLDGGPIDEDEDQPHHLVDAGTGEVERTEDLTAHVPLGDVEEEFGGQAEGQEEDVEVEPVLTDDDEIRVGDGWSDPSLLLPEMMIGGSGSGSGSGSGGLRVDTALALHPLTNYDTGDGSAVTAFTGCAPDGLRHARADTAVGGERCVKPRLFTIDHGA